VKALLLFAVAAVVAVPFAMPKRRDLIPMRAKHEIEVVHGCTVFAPGLFDDEDGFEKTRYHVIEVQRDGPVAMYDTPIGSIWYPLGTWTLPALVEMSEADPYHLRSTVKNGDVVLDVGANVGTETRSALAAGAALVVAIEPDPLSLECLRRNLSAEIREKRVVVVSKGAWDKEGISTLHLDPENAGAASFMWQTSDRSVQVPMTTIDRVVADLSLKKVSIIKLHIEGAEQKALLGAAETIRRFHPRLAFSLEHYLDDVDVLPAVVRGMWPGYHLELTPCIKTFKLIHPGAALMAP